MTPTGRVRENRSQRHTRAPAYIVLDRMARAEYGSTRHHKGFGANAQIMPSKGSGLDSCFSLVLEDNALPVSESPHKVFALFGSNVEAANQSFLEKKVHREHYALLALDSAAMGLLEEARLPYTVLDDWLDPETRLRVQHEALTAERSWFEPARKEFTEQGICWPEIDQYMMRGFWVQSMMALALGKALRDRGSRLLSFFGSYLPRPAMSWNPSDVAAALWRTESVAKTKEIKSFTLGGSDLGVAAIWAKVARRLPHRVQGSRGSRPTGVSGELHRKIVLVLAYVQKDRYAYAVDHLKSHFPGRVAAVLAGPYPDLAEKLSAEWAIPVASGPPLPVLTLVPQLPLWLSRSCDPDLARRFLGAYDTCTVASKGQPWHVPLASLPFHFRFYCSHWWPTLCRRTASFWFDLFKAQQPAALMVPAVESVEQLLPCIAAENVGVPTFVLPEAALRTVGFSGLFTKSRFLCDLPIQKTFLERSGYAAERLMGVRSILSDLQYPSRQTPTFVSEDKLHVLVLTNPTGMPGLLMHMISLRAQFQALRILANPPEDVGRFVELRLKVHPKYHDLEMIAAVSKDLVNQVLPPETDLEHALSRTDLVVAANYHGSALVHCLRLGKPAILLSTEPDVLLNSPLWSTDMFLCGVTVLRDGTQFWQAIERFRSDPHVRPAMQRLSQTFAEEHLDQKTYPPLHEVLREMMGDGLGNPPQP